MNRRSTMKHDSSTPLRPSISLGLTLMLALALAAGGCGRSAEATSSNASTATDAQSEAVTHDASTTVDAQSEAVTHDASAPTEQAVALAPPTTRAAAARTPAPQAETTANVPRDAAEMDLPSSPVIAPAFVRRAALARQVVDREPVDPTTTFSANGEPLYAFFAFTNPSNEDLDIQVRFVRPNGSSIPAITLHVPASARRFRSWAYTRGAQRPGVWTAVAETSDGTEIARLPFTIVP